MLAREPILRRRSHKEFLYNLLDVAFREDDCRVRAGNAGENFAVIRNFAVNLMKDCLRQSASQKAQSVKSSTLIYRDYPPKTAEQHP